MSAERKSFFDPNLPTPVGFSYLSTEGNFPGGINTQELRNKVGSLLSTAKREIGLLGEPKKRADYYLDLCVVQLTLGENPTQLIEETLQFAPKDRIGEDSILYRAGLIAAYAGNYDYALALAKEAGGSYHSWPLQNITEVVHSSGGDSQPFLEALSSALETETAWFAKHKDLSGLLVMSYTETAELMIKIGKDPEPFLRKAEDILAANPDSSWAYVNLISVRAAQGNIALAKEMVDRIRCPKNSEDEKRRSLAIIARAQAEQEDFAASLQTAKETGLGVVVTDVLLDNARYLAKKGEDPTEILEQTINYARNVPNGEFFFLSSSPTKEGLAKVYAEAGRILALAGKNPEEKFLKAVQTAKSLSGEDSQIRRLMEIAPVIRASGKETWELYRRALLKYDESIRLKDDLIPLFDIHKSALESGYRDFVEEIMARVEKVGRREPKYVEGYYPQFLIQTAFSYAQWARHSQS